MIDTSGKAEDIRSKLGLLVTGAAAVCPKTKPGSKGVQRVSEDWIEGSEEGQWNTEEKVMNYQVPLRRGGPRLPERQSAYTCRAIDQINKNTKTHIIYVTKSY
jgi:hypothetical protein